MVERHITALKPVRPVRGVEPLCKKWADLRPPKLCPPAPQRDELNFGPDLANVKVGMRGTVSAVDVEQLALSSALTVLVECAAHGYAVATFLTHGIQEVVQRALILFDILDEFCAHGVAMAVEPGVHLQLGSTGGGFDIVNGLAVGKLAAGDEGFEFAGGA